MEPKLPIPTDNIYKFLATFGLVIMAVSMALIVMISNQTNEVIWNNANATFELESNQSSSLKDDKLKLLKKKVEIAIVNRSVLTWILAFLFAIGFYSSLYGFYHWYKKIQPIHDEILELQRKKLISEVKLLEKQKRSYSKRS